MSDQAKQPWDFATDKYFQTGDRVVITDVSNGGKSYSSPMLEGAAGTIGGIAFDHVIKTYIVILDKEVETPWLPMKTQKAVVFPNGFLRYLEVE